MLAGGVGLIALGVHGMVAIFAASNLEANPRIGGEDLPAALAGAALGAGAIATAVVRGPSRLALVLPLLAAISFAWTG